jgi:Ser/Thr protein kinase RdoA (MazF antagonist)
MFGGKKALPALRSVLAPESLLRAAREHYVIERGASCDLIHSGINDTYEVTAEDQHFVLRVYRYGWRQQPELQWELSLLEHLDAEGAPVAAPIRTRSGNRFSIVLAPEGPRPVALFQFAPGTPCRAQSMTVHHARAYGRGLAALHLRMDDFAPEYPRFEIDFDRLLNHPLKVLEPRMTERPQDLTYLQRVADDIREAIVEFDNQGMTKGLCHGGATGINAHLDQRGDFTFFDFDNAGAGWRAYDIASFRWGMLRYCGRRKADENYKAFLEGYREVRGLTRVDEDAVPPFVAAREIWRMGQDALTTNEQGYAFMHNPYFDDAINFLHDWYKEMLAYS